MEHLTLEIADGLAVVTLNRPEKKNALSEKLFSELPQAAEQIANDHSVRAVILTGAGGAFSAGIDLAFLRSMVPQLDDIKAEMAGPTPNKFQRPCTCWSDLKVPVIAVIEGVCIGAGLQLALGADFRFAHPDAKFSIMESRWGLIPDMGITQSLPKLMRADQAKALIMTAQMIPSEKAHALGLVTDVSDDPMAMAKDLVDQMVQRSPEAVAHGKSLVDKTWTMAPGDGLSFEGALQASLMGSPNQVEAVMAGMTKRPPNYS